MKKIEQLSVLFVGVFMLAGLGNYLSRKETVHNRSIFLHKGPIEEFVDTMTKNRTCGNFSHASQCFLDQIQEQGGVKSASDLAFAMMAANSFCGADRDCVYQTGVGVIESIKMDPVDIYRGLDTERTVVRNHMVMFRQEILIPYYNEQAGLERQEKVLRWVLSVDRKIAQFTETNGAVLPSSAVAQF